LSLNIIKKRKATGSSTVQN